MSTVSTIFIMLLSLSLNAQETSLFNAVHASGDTLQLTLDVDFRRLLKKKTERTFIPATARLSFGGSEVKLKANTRRRGNARLQQCPLPGLKLRFDKKALATAGFTGEMNDWKLVLPCSDSYVGNLYLKREAFGYQLYGMLSEAHIRTIPAILTMGERRRKIFIIEHPEQLSERYNGYENPDDKCSSRSLEKESYVRLCLFNYMIQNTDFAIFNLHNVAVIARDSSVMYTAFPYDFDYSGLVGRRYAVPAEGLGTESTYERVWLGRHVTDEELAEQVAYFESKRVAISEFAETYFARSKPEQKRVRRMLDGLYRDVGRL